MLTTVSIQALGLGSGALLARILGVQNRGLFAATILWPMVAAHVGDLGGPIANTYIAATKPNDVRRLIGNSLLITVAQTAVLAVLIAPIMLVSLRRYGDVVGVALMFLVVYIPANLIYRYLNFINQGLRNFGGFNTARISLQLSYLLAIVVMFITHHGDIRTVLAAYAVSHVIAALVAWIGLGYDYRTLSVSRPLMRETFAYGIRAHLGNLTPIDMMQLDLAVVVLVLGPRDAGLYAVASSAALVLRAYGGAIGSVALPHVASADYRQARRDGIGDMFRLSALMIVPTAALIIGLAPWLVPLVYGRAFAPAISIAQLLAAAMICAALRQVLGSCLRGAGKPLDATMAEIASWIVAGLGLVLLVPRLGNMGAAAAVGLSYFVGLSILVAFALQYGLSPSQLFRLRRSDVSRGWSVLHNMATVGQTMRTPSLPWPR